MKSGFTSNGNYSNIFFISSCSVIQTVGDEFCRLTGFAKKEIIHKSVYEVMRKLLRTTESAVNRLVNGETTECIIFCKTLQAKLIVITVREEEECSFYFAAEKNLFRGMDGDGVAGRLMHDNVHGVAVFSAPELMLLKANERFLTLLDKPFHSPDHSMGKTIGELIPWATFGHAKDIWLSSISLGKTYYGKGVKGRSGRWKDRFCDMTLLPLLENGRVKFLVCIIEDVTEAVLIREKSENLAKVVTDQNERLKKKNALLSTVVDNIVDGIVIFNENRNYTMMNKAARELFAVGNAPMQKLGDVRRNARLLDENGEVLPPELYTSNRLLAGETVSNLQMTIETEEHVRHTEVRGVPIYGETGEFLAGFMRIRDITEQKNEQKLVAAMEKIRGIVHSTLNFEELMENVLTVAAKAVGCESAAISLRQGNEWLVTNMYRFSANIIGMRMDDKLEPHSRLAIMTGKPVVIEDAYHDSRVNQTHMKRWNIRAVIVVPLLAGDEPVGVMYFNFHKGAMHFTTALVEFAVNLGTSLSMAMQNIRLYEKVCYDLSEQEQLKEELQIEKSRMEAVIENMSDALFIMDPNGNYTTLNKTAREYHLPYFSKMPRVGEGHPATHFVGSDGKIIAPEDAPAQRVLRGEKLVGYKMTIQAPERLIYADVSGTPIYDDKGKLIAGIICSRDETEHIKMDNLLKKQNKQLEEALKMKDEFLTLLSHEFRTPITVVNAAIQAMENLYANELSYNAKRLVKIIKQNQYRQLRLVNNLLEAARMNAGRAKVNMKNYDIVAQTKVIVESVQLYAQEKKVHLSFSSPAERKIIGLDEEKYERILLNLLSNAIKFTRTGGRIWVQLKLSHGIVEIIVKDEGIGIPKEKLPTIFERFAQADSLLSRDAEGTGIGLNLVKLYTQLLGGTVTVKSRERKGSTFTVRLPDTVVMEKPEAEDATSEEMRLGQNTAIEFSDLYLVRGEK